MNDNRAAQLAKEYILGALSAMLDLGKESESLHHCFEIRNKSV